jgi:putative membrane protein
VPPKPALSAADRDELARAVAAAERRTSGEVVISIVESCDDYQHASWKGMALGALGGVLLAAGVYATGRVWWSVWLWILAPASAGAAVGYLAATMSDGLRRRLVAPELLAHRVDQRAAAAFLRAGLSRTRDRTGILIFLALFEHRVEVLADTGISATVAQADWDAIAGDIAAGMKSGAPMPALLHAIERCGELLESHRLAPRPDDSDELPNRVRTED